MANCWPTLSNQLVIQLVNKVSDWQKKFFTKFFLNERLYLKGMRRSRKGRKYLAIFSVHTLSSQPVVRHCIRYIYLSFFALFLPDRHENWNTKARQKSAAIMVKLFLSIFEILTLQTRFRSQVFLIHTSNLFKADVKLNKKYFAFFPSWSICKGHNRAKT